MLKKLFSLIFLLTLFNFAAFSRIFYKVEGNGLKTPSYIFGTHHLAPLSVMDSYPGLKTAMETSEAVVGEIDMTVPQIQLLMAMQPYMTAPADSTLQALLSPEELTLLNKRFKPYSPQPGIDLYRLGIMRPMVISTMVSMTEIQKSLPGFDPEKQIDSQFQKEFKKAGKKIIALETPEKQAELLYTFIPITKQLEDLKELLENPDEIVSSSKKLNEAYLKGDLDTLAELTQDEDADPAFMNALTTLRNKEWLDRLPAIMMEQPSLIVVGALHLAGKDGIIEGLRREGFTVTPIE